MLNKSISRYLEKAYEREERQLKRKIEAVKEAVTLNPREYGQDANLISCPLNRSIETLQELNKAIVPFEIATIIAKTHKIIPQEIEEYSLQINKVIPVTEDIITASLMMVFLNARVLQAMKCTMYMEYFSYVEEVSISIKRK